MPADAGLCVGVSDIRDIPHTEICWPPHGCPLETGLDRQSALLLPFRADGLTGSGRGQSGRSGQAPQSPHPRITGPGLERRRDERDYEGDGKGGDKVG